MKVPELVVLKFGSSVLRSEADLPAAVHEIYAHRRRGSRVLAVVSALGDTTEELLARARASAPEPEPRLVAQLLATGEIGAAALLALALERAGVPSTLLSPEGIGLRTEGPTLDAQPVALDAAALRAELERCPIAVLPGFIGRSPAGELTLLGRGGSDLSALFVAERLGAERCVLLKDVDGLYQRDPRGDGPPPRRYERVAFADALKLSGQIVQHKALRFARDARLLFEVGALGNPRRTLVGTPRSLLATDGGEHAPALRVALLGLGTVGRAVYERLHRWSADFDTVSILVRETARHARSGVPRGLLTTGADELFASRPDVVIEALGGAEPAAGLLARALGAGIDAISANKAALSARGIELAELAAASGARLDFSASVGGAVPMLEIARRAGRSARVLGFEGVLNGTSNFVLERLAEGHELARAVREAQERGFAEADPTLDLNGTDACHKLELLAREVYGPGCPLGWERREGIEGLAPADLAAARERGSTIRLVARCRLEGGRPVASVGPTELAHGHPLAGVRGATSALVLETADGAPLVLSGTGAGPWPTAEAVLGDLFELRAQRRTDPATPPAGTAAAS